MWYDATLIKLIQKYLNVYAQIKLHFDAKGNIQTVALFQEGKWILSPTLAKHLQLQHISLPIRQEAFITLKR